MKILVIEDDRTIALGLKHTLSEKGYDISLAFSVKESLVHFERDVFDIILLDLGLPDGNGLDVLSIIREVSDVPVIVLTARDEEHSVNAGFDLGADDYITKPFKVSELIRRIEAIQKRSNVIRMGSLVININDAKVSVDDVQVILSVIEYQLLIKLARNYGHIVTREELIRQVWSSEEFVSANTLSVNIKRLRERLNDAVTITAVPGKGYRLE